MNDNNKTKCLVSEAQDKCTCEWCNTMRYWRQQQLQFIVMNEIHKIINPIIASKQEEVKQ